MLCFQKPFQQLGEVVNEIVTSGNTANEISRLSIEKNRIYFPLPRLIPFLEGSPKRIFSNKDPLFTIDHSPTNPTNFIGFYINQFTSFFRNRDTPALYCSSSLRFLNNKCRRK
jgi:hypothetical protein